MKAVILVCVGVMISGCAAQVISTSNRSVMVKARVQDVAQAQSLADEECKKHGRYARLSMKPMPNQFVYDCVE